MDKTEEEQEALLEYFESYDENYGDILFGENSEINEWLREFTLCFISLRKPVNEKDLKSDCHKDPRRPNSRDTLNLSGHLFCFAGD